MKGKLIAIEGSDGSGKTVQSKLLFDRLKKKKNKAFLIEFPQYYKNIFGKLIGLYLSGDFTLSPYTASLLYAWDRLDAREKIKEMLKKGYTVIANRYIASNIAHQAARLSQKEQSKFISWLQDVELKKNKMPCPDLIFYLYVPVKISQKLIEKKQARKYIKGKKKDIHEKNISYLKKVEVIYKKLSKQKNWIRINCVKNNKIMSKKEIHNLVWDKLSSHLRIQ